MRNLSILLVAILCSSCALRTFDIQKAPLKPNQAVVFDIDGTLTPKVSAIYTARDGAASAVQLFAKNGYKIIYLSARTRLLQSGIPDWLKKHDFPEGSIQVPQTSTDSSDHAAFKTRILKKFQAKGWNIFAAYGDSSTDFEAYSEAHIDKEHVFALRRAGEDSCQPGIWAECLNSWADHTDHIKQMVQP
jgi:phosphatidate phosphatase PAH1